MVPWSFAVNVADEPWIVLPYSTEAATGVQIHTTVEMAFPDGTTTVAGVIIQPP